MACSGRALCKLDLKLHPFYRSCEHLRTALSLVRHAQMCGVGGSSAVIEKFGMVCGLADVGPVLQGLIRHFRPEMEERIGAFSERIKIAA